MNALGTLGRMRRLSAFELGGLALLVLATAAVPLVLDSQYWLLVMVSGMIILVLNTAWNFILGIAGVWHFGMLAVYALGGYAADWLMLHSGLPAVVCLLLAGVFSAVISSLLAFPTLRLFGIYTSLLTFAFAQVVLFVVINDPGGLTGGTFGSPRVPGLFPHLRPTQAMHAYYWTMLVVVAVATLAVAAINSSRLGIALRTIRDAPALAAARGVDPLRYRVYAFAISGFIAGIAGGLYLAFSQSITTAAMGLTPMSIDVTMLVIGGLGTIFGPLIGTALLTLIQALLSGYPGIQLSILGTILLVIVIFVPGGIAGLIARIVRRLSSWVAEDEG